MPFVEIVIVAPIVLAALVVHEYAHARAAYALGDPTAAERGRMTLNPLAHLDPIGTLLMFTVHVGWARPVPVAVHRLPNGYLDFGLVAAAGPAANVAMASLSALLLWIVAPATEIRVDLMGVPSFDSNTLEGLVGYVLFVSVFYNLAFAFFNLLPIPPLDGANVFRAFLPHGWAWETGRHVRVGVACILALVVAGRFFPVNPLLWFLSVTTKPAVLLLTGYAPFA